MPRSKKPFTVTRRVDSKTYQFTLNPTCGLPDRVCRNWQRANFQKLPPALAHHRFPKNKGMAEMGVYELIQHLKNEADGAEAKRLRADDISVGEWLEKFALPEKKPRAALLAARNRPYSVKTMSNYDGYYRCYIKMDPIVGLKMSEVEEQDVLEFTNRLANTDIGRGGNRRKMIGTRTFEAVVKFVRMAFKEYRRTHRKWFNPFDGIEAPQAAEIAERGALSEDEVVALFAPGVLADAMELAVCGAMFLSGLRRAEIFALKSDCLDWNAPKITVKNAWQNFDRKDRVLGPTKGKRRRAAPFDPILQEAIRQLWEKNGRHEFVFSFPNGKTPGPSWIKGRFPKWLKKAGIEMNGRDIVPHSSRHSLASLLEARGVPLRYIQDLLGHSDLKTTKIYLHSTEKTIRDIGIKISEVVAEKGDEGKVVEFKVS